MKTDEKVILKFIVYWRRKRKDVLIRQALRGSRGGCKPLHWGIIRTKSLTFVTLPRL